MSPTLDPKMKRALPWALGGLASVLAFGLGTCLASGGGETAAAPDTPRDAEEATIFSCSMHPQIRSHEPGQCPICGMDLIPVTSSSGEPAPNEVRLSERAKTLARIRTTEVERHGAGTRGRRLLGRVAYDETNLATVTAWISGRIDRLLVEVTGQNVRRGQIIARLYSPEVFAAHQDLLQAKRQVERLSGGTDTAQRTAQAAYRAARQRLSLLGVPEAELAQMERADGPSQHVAIRSPFAGTVIERLATEGQYVQTGTPLYRIANLRELWVQLDAYESDLPLLHVGQTVHLDVRALPGEPIEGRVAFIDPVVDPRTRTAKVRVEVPNRDGRLSPGMFAEAHVEDREPQAEETDAAPLVIPDSAPLFTGRRSLVYVEVPNVEQPTYEARVVSLGPKMGDVYPVIAGLSEGERVVTHGAFTLDADLQIRGGFSMMTLPDDAETGPYDDLIDVPPAFSDGLARVLGPYLELQEALADDDLARAKTAGESLRAAGEAFEPEAPDRAVRRWHELREGIVQHARHVAGAADLDAAREGFRGLTDAMLELTRSFGNPMDETVRVAFCPMAGDNAGAPWLQRGERVDNPYFGSEMLTCGEVRHVLDAKGHMPADLSRSIPRSPPPAAAGHQH